jgi:hypothetical protein
MTAFGKTGAPCTSCGSYECDGVRCYFETPECEPEEGDTGITLAELREIYGSQLTECLPDPLLNKKRAA